MASPPKALQWLPHVPAVWRLYPPTSSHTSLPVRPLRPHFGPSPLCLCGHRALVHAVPSAKDASTLPSTRARHHPSDLNYSLPPYIMYLATPVISGPLRRVFGGEASRELPPSLSLPRSWLCVPTSQRGDIPTGQWSPGLLLPHLASSHHPWPPLGVAVVLPTLYSPYPAEGSITCTQLPS